MFIIWIEVPDEWQQKQPKQPKQDRRLYFIELEAYAIACWADYDYQHSKITAQQYYKMCDTANDRINYVYSIMRN